MRAQITALGAVLLISAPSLAARCDGARGRDCTRFEFAYFSRPPEYEELGALRALAERNKLQIFGSVDDACRWLAPLHEIDAVTLLEAYQKATAGIAR